MNSIWTKTLLVAATSVAMVIGSSAIASATPGALDTSFGGGDGTASVIASNLPYAMAYATAVQADGKIVAVGCTDVCGALGDEGHFLVARFASGGALDPTFAGTGYVITSFGGSSDMAHAVAIQPDGKIVVAGCNGCNWLGASDFAIARYNTNGSLDQTFGTAGKVVDDLYWGPLASTDVANGVAVQSDGKIVVGGFSDASFAVARYTANGERDKDFGGLVLNRVGNKGVVTTSFRYGGLGFALALRPDGKIVLAGDAGRPDGLGDAAVVQYRPSGVLDAGFGNGGIATMPFASTYRAVQGVALQADGKVVVAGQTQIAHDERNDSDFMLGRLTGSGHPDAGFGSFGLVRTDFTTSAEALEDVAQGVAVQSDGKIVAVGYSFGGLGGGFHQNQAIARYLPNGALDPTFGLGGRVTEVRGFGQGVALQTDGRILCAGQAAGPFAVVRYLSS
jgi:uncharacterized delta-60 repeat protein